ncbi:hypothetical protein AVEN_208999-1 [Araneus ventricosus]|uniref:Uncharacterized protein n=1 Tax=Araneus ventricosus TaxID=182803 RepID=A0A4Y2PJ98_ARAVE|nr:hypothetical protein AVEN_208999-1 [Araneus ventricosus]
MQYGQGTRDALKCIQSNLMHVIQFLRFGFYLCLRPVLQKHEDYFETDFVIWSRRQMTTTTTPELASPLRASAPHQREYILFPTDLAYTRPAYTAALLWSRVSNLQPSGPVV